MQKLDLQGEKLYLHGEFKLLWKKWRSDSFTVSFELLDYFDICSQLMFNQTVVVSCFDDAMILYGCYGVELSILYIYSWGVLF